MKHQSVNPEFGSTLARRLNQSCFSAVLQSNQIAIYGSAGMPEARVWTGHWICKCSYFIYFT